MKNLKAIRERAKKSQKEISEVLKISERSYGTHERDGKLRADLAETLANYYSDLFGYRVSIDYLMGLTDRPFADPSISEFMKATHLSEAAISTLLADAAPIEKNKDRNNQNIFMLDLILSDRELFKELMKQLLFLIYPPTTAIPTDLIENEKEGKKGKKKKKTGIYRDDNFLMIEPRFLDAVIIPYLPDNLYRNMRKALEKFVVEKPHPECITPNEWDPARDITMEVLESLKKHAKKL